MALPVFLIDDIAAREAFTTIWRVKYVLLCGALMFSGLLLALSALTRRVAIPAGFFMLVSMFAGFTNARKLVYRNTPILPGDVLMLRDGATAAAEFDLVFTPTMIALTVLCFLILFLLIPVRLPDAVRKRRFAGTIACILAGMAVFAGLLFGVFFNGRSLNNLGYRFFPQDVTLDYEYNTFFPAFLRLIPDTIVWTPEEYSGDAMEKIGAEIAALAPETSAGLQADVVILQVESFFIPDEYDLEYDEEDVFGEFLDLAETSAGGRLISPLFGGGTADVEFEVLTGFTSNGNQITTNPFSKYIYEGFPNIVGYLGTQGYESVSVHSYGTGFYNRVNVYRDFGFGRSVFVDSFVDPEYRGDWVADGSCIDKAIEEYEAMQEQGGRLLHIVTMQNHVPIQWDAYDERDLVPASSGTLRGEELKAARIYLTSCREICREIRRFAEYLDSTGRNVILIVYGDHQIPILGIDQGMIITVPMITDLPKDGGEYTALTHGTPFFVHTTFESDIEGENWGRLAPNSLLVKALCETGVRRPAYFQYLYGSQAVVKSLPADFSILKNETVVLDLTDEMEADLRERRLIQHDIVHGERFLLGRMY